MSHLIHFRDNLNGFEGPRERREGKQTKAPQISATVFGKLKDFDSLTDTFSWIRQHLESDWGARPITCFSEETATVYPQAELSVHWQDKKNPKQNKNNSAHVPDIKSEAEQGHQHR